MSTWDAILTSAPINATAARVVAQPRSPAEQGDMGPEEIKPIVARLERKQRLLKVVLGITNKAQHKNLTYRLNKVRGARLKANPRSAIEYKRVGEEIHRMHARLCELRAERRKVAEEEHSQKGLAA